VYEFKQIGRYSREQTGQHTSWGLKSDLVAVGAEHAAAASRQCHYKANDCQNPPKVPVLGAHDGSEALLLANGVHPTIQQIELHAQQNDTYNKRNENSNHVDLGGVQPESQTRVDACREDQEGELC